MVDTPGELERVKRSIQDRSEGVGPLRVCHEHMADLVISASIAGGKALVDASCCLVRTF